MAPGIIVGVIQQLTVLTMRATLPASSARPRTGIEDFAAETLRFVAAMTAADGIAMHLFDENAQRIWLGSRESPVNSAPRTMMG